MTAPSADAMPMRSAAAPALTLVAAVATAAAPIDYRYRLCHEERDVGA